ncbi:MAG: chemotaxis protein CheW [Anaerolineae bacterium]
MINLPGHEAVRLPVLTFRLGRQQFALLIEDVIEVVAMVELSRLPDAPAEMPGMVNRHGAVLPLLDLRAVFGQPITPITSESVFIVAEGGGKQIGLLVDEVQQVDYLDALQMNDAPTSSRYIHGIMNHYNEMISIIALPSLLTTFLTSKIAPEGF